MGGLRANGNAQAAQAAKAEEAPKTPESNDDAGTMVDALKNIAPQRSDEVLSDENIDIEEAVKKFANTLNFGDEALDWKTIKVLVFKEDGTYQEVSPE